MPISIKKSETKDLVQIELFISSLSMISILYENKEINQTQFLSTTVWTTQL